MSHPWHFHRRWDCDDCARARARDHDESLLHDLMTNDDPNVVPALDPVGTTAYDDAGVHVRDVHENGPIRSMYLNRIRQSRVSPVVLTTL